jgi:hypothetical protein
VQKTREFTKNKRRKKKRNSLFIILGPFHFSVVFLLFLLCTIEDGREQARPDYGQWRTGGFTQGTGGGGVCSILLTVFIHTYTTDTVHYI